MEYSKDQQQKWQTLRQILCSMGGGWVRVEAAHFRSKRRWFGSDIAHKTATKRSEFEFCVVASKTQDGKLVERFEPLAQKLLSCCSAIGDVERCHKKAARTRIKVSNRKLESATEAYGKIAVSESYKK